MSEAPLQPDASSPTLRRIDWLAIAPWTLLFRVPGIALGKPFFFGTLGSLFLGIYPQTIELDSYSLHEIYRFVANYLNLLVNLPAKQIHLLRDPPEWQNWGMHLAWLFAWSFLGLCIVEHASRLLTNNPATSFFRLLKKGVTSLPKVGGVFLLAIGTSLLFALPLVIASWLLNLELIANLLYRVWPVLALVFGIPVFLLLTGLLVFSPLALSAIAVDRADMFDATSRMYAYTYQKPLRLVGYIGVALLLGILCLYLLIVVLSGTDLLLNELIGTRAQHVWLQALIQKIPFGYACGYFYTATSAIYFLLRRDIDDQPLDEMAI